MTDSTDYEKLIRSSWNAYGKCDSDEDRRAYEQEAALWTIARELAGIHKAIAEAGEPS